jgi:SAM-dependent methyltransferase
MHGSVMLFLASVLKAPDVAGREVLEIGSLDVNGSPRNHILPLGPKKYVGIDTAPGKGVDLVLDGSTAREYFGESAFDIVLCCEVLEHAENWKAVVSTAKRVLRHEGVLVFTTRSPGFQYHPYPVDLWRFTEAIFAQVFSDMKVELLCRDWEYPGVFMKARKPKDFKEADLSKVEAIPMVQPA